MSASQQQEAAWNMAGDESANSSPNYTFVLPFEQTFQHLPTQEWMRDYWHTSFLAVAIYLAVIFLGQQIMSSRPPFKLKGLLTLWNLSLALFSIIGTLRTWPELLHVVHEFGFKHSVCQHLFMDVKPAGYWSWMFSLSKVYELGDTLFIVLRKQPLLFLHWYHHITVLLYTWYTYSEYPPAARWFVCINYAIHSLMYSYYALKASGLCRIPRPISMVITTAQIMQMIIGAYVIAYAYNRKLQGDPCNISHECAVYGLTIYLTYFILFVHFFYRAYFHPQAARKERKLDSSITTTRDRRE